MASGTASVRVTNWLLSSVGLTTGLSSSLLHQVIKQAPQVMIKMAASIHSFLCFIISSVIPYLFLHFQYAAHALVDALLGVKTG